MELKKERQEVEKFLSDIVKQLTAQQLQRVADIALGFTLLQNYDVKINPKAKENAHD